MSDKTYTIQEIREMLVVHANEMNPYKYLDAAVGIIVVQDFLSEVQCADKLERNEKNA